MTSREFRFGKPCASDLAKIGASYATLDKPNGPGNYCGDWRKGWLIGIDNGPGLCDIPPSWSADKPRAPPFSREWAVWALRDLRRPQEACLADNASLLDDRRYDYGPELNERGWCGLC